MKETERAERGLIGPYGLAEADISRCVHCGLCLPHCPTYTELGLETESPRGRLYTIKAMAQGRVGPTATVIAHLDLCLQCRHCQAVCPSGIPFARIMDGVRAHILANQGGPLSWRIRTFFLRELISYPHRLDLMARFLRLYDRAGLRFLAERLLPPGPLRHLALMAPTVDYRPFPSASVLAEPQGPLRHRVALLTGCIMPFAFGRVNRATVRVLARNGCQVVAPPAQVCCGALHLHAGDRLCARRLARRNIDAFLEAGVDAIVVNSAGCSAAMKEYGQLLADDRGYAQKAQRLAAMVKDVTEFLAELPLQAPAAAFRARATYQDPCHLAHAQGLKEAPRAVLAAIPGLQLVEMEEPDRCCGGAGIYGLAHPQMSLRLLSRKMRDVAATRAEIIATANPGCMLQLEAGLRRNRLPGRVMHVVELLDLAYRQAGAAYRPAATGV